MVHEGMWDPRTDMKAGLVALHSMWYQWEDTEAHIWFMCAGATEVVAVKHKDRQAQVSPHDDEGSPRSREAHLNNHLPL